MLNLDTIRTCKCRMFTPRSNISRVTFEKVDNDVTQKVHDEQPVLNIYAIDEYE